MTETDVSGLTQVGAASALPASPYQAVLEKVPSGHASTLYCVRFTAPEFTSLCRMTSQPDFAHIVIDYVPLDLLVERKSLEPYLRSFPYHGAFHKDYNLDIGQQLLTLLDRVWLLDQCVAACRGRG